MDGSILNAFGTLSLVVAAMGVLLFIVKKYAKKKNSGNELLDMKILSRMTLSPKNHLFIVQAGEKKLLLGVSESGIRNLTEISESEIPLKTVVPKTVRQTVNNVKPSDSLSFKSFLKSTFSAGAN